MKEGIIENVVSEEIDRHYSNVFTEFKTDILLTEDKVAHIYLGPLEKNVFVRHEDTKNKIVSYGYRKINLEVSSLNFSDPIIASWLENGFEFFNKLGEKSINLRWEHRLDRIKTSPKEKDVIELIRDFEQANGKPIYYEYFDSTPSFGIKDDINEVRKFINSYKKAINLDEAILKNYHYQTSRELCLNITKNLFFFESLGTNLDAKKYSKMVDEFLGD